MSATLRWRNALATAQFSLSQRALPLSWTRRTLRDLRAEDWSTALRVFDTCVLSGGAMDTVTMTESAMSCSCGQCSSRRRCTGVALMCACETPATSDETIATDRMSSTVIRRLALANAVLQQRQQSIVPVAASSVAPSTESTFDELRERWRIMEHVQFNHTLKFGQIIALVRDTLAVLHDSNSDAREGIERFIAELVAYAPVTSRFALWANVWRCAAHADTPLDQLPCEKSSNKKWLPPSSRSLDAALLRLAGDVDEEQQQQQQQLLIPSPELLEDMRGLTCIAEHSRHSDILLPPSMLVRVMDSNLTGPTARNVRAILKVFFPTNGASPPKKVVVMSLVDELRFRAAAATTTATTTDANAAVGLARSIKRSVSKSRTLMFDPRVNAISVGVISKRRRVQEECIAAGIEFVK